MRLLLALLITVSAYGQEAATQTKPDEKAPAKTEEKAAETAAAPAAAGEQWLTGSFDFGYRWVGDIRGNPLQYRSVVNLGEGPKLTGLDFTLTDPKRRVFDRIDARADGWGGDPNSTLSALSHAVAQTDPKFGESCDICHSAGKDFDVLKEHAGK